MYEKNDIQIVGTIIPKMMRHTRQCLLEFLILINLMVSVSFIGSFHRLPINCECNERTIYRQYLLGLRKTRRYTQINKLVSILNFTNKFIENYTDIGTSSMHINNTEVVVKNIMMGNIVLDVSTVKEIHISTSKDKIILELDRQQRSVNILDNLNNLETIMNTLSLLGKLSNLN